MAIASFALQTETQVVFSLKFVDFASLTTLMPPSETLFNFRLLFQVHIYMFSRRYGVCLKNIRFKISMCLSVVSFHTLWQVSCTSWRCFLTMYEYLVRITLANELTMTEWFPKDLSSCKARLLHCREKLRQGYWVLSVTSGLPVTTSFKREVSWNPLMTRKHVLLYLGMHQVPFKNLLNTLNVCSFFALSIFKLAGQPLSLKKPQNKTFSSSPQPHPIITQPRRKWSKTSPFVRDLTAREGLNPRPTISGTQHKTHLFAKAFPQWWADILS